MQPTSNKEYVYRTKGRDELCDRLKAAKKATGKTYAELAQEVGTSKEWLACAIDGYQWVPPEFATKIAKALGVSDADVAFLTDHPYKGYADPILYRLHEVFDTYGPSLKELIHEEFGNAIMSAIDFTIDLKRVPDPKGDRIVITFNGKCLPYSNKGEYPW